MPNLPRRGGVILAVVLLINYNASRTGLRYSMGLGGAKTQSAIYRSGSSNLATGGRIMTAAGQQGSNQCVSTYNVPPDTPTAMCQSFCSTKFKKFHCMWCKCRACDFCPKGGEAIEEASKDASPPPPAATASFAHLDMEPPPPSSPPAVVTDTSPAVEAKGQQVNESATALPEAFVGTLIVSNTTDPAVRARERNSTFPSSLLSDASLDYSKLGGSAHVAEVSTPAAATPVSVATTETAPAKATPAAGRTASTQHTATMAMSAADRIAALETALSAARAAGASPVSQAQSPMLQNASSHQVTTAATTATAAAATVPTAVTAVTSIVTRNFTGAAAGTTTATEITDDEEMILDVNGETNDS